MATTNELLQAQVDSYRSSRASLIDQDRALRREFSTLDTRPLSAEEVKADRIVRKIRAEEAESVWNQEYEGVPHPFPGMEFLTGRDIIVKTKIFEILSKMPKGALLHAHLDATVNAKFLWKLALEQPALHIKVPHALTSSNIGSTLPTFLALPQDQFTQAASITDASYIPDSWVPIQNARRNFDQSLGGPEGFDNWVVASMMINPTEAYKTHNTVLKIWDKFTSTFMVSVGLVRFAPLWPNYIREFFRTSIEDGISYVEVRINFLYKSMVGADGHDSVTHREMLIMFETAMNEIKQEMKEKGREGEFVGARIIYSTIRFISCEELEWYTEDCIKLKKEFPHLIAGFDLVGDENRLIPLIDYIEPLLKFKRRQQEEGVDIPFILHAGETLGDGTAADNNLYDAILLGTKRIGHAFSLVKHPKLLEICREKGILIEVCPISNEILRLTSSMPMHPLPVVINNGVPVALCSDDPSVFGNMGLSFDYYQVLVASEVNGLSTLGQIARDSLLHSTLDDKDKEMALALWEKQWQKFISEINAQYAL